MRPLCCAQRGYRCHLDLCACWFFIDQTNWAHKIKNNRKSYENEIESDLEIANQIELDNTDFGDLACIRIFVKTFHSLATSSSSALLSTRISFWDSEKLAVLHTDTPSAHRRAHNLNSMLMKKKHIHFLWRSEKRYASAMHVLNKISENDIKVKCLFVYVYECCIRYAKCEYWNHSLD